RHFICALHPLGKALALRLVQAPTTCKAALLGAGGHDQKHESRRQSGDQKHFSHKKSSVLFCKSLVRATASRFASFGKLDAQIVAPVTNTLKSITAVDQKKGLSPKA